MYRAWEELMKGAESGLLETELTFSSVDKGTMHYYGEYKGSEVYCSVGEVEVRDYCYSLKERVSCVTQGAYVCLKVGNKEILRV